MDNENNSGTNATSAPEEPKTDYKKLYEAALADSSEKKKKMDALEASLKAYKDKEEEARKAALPPEKKAAEDIDERDKIISSLMAKLNRNDVDRVFSEGGYKADQFNDIADAICSTDLFDEEKKGEHRIEIAKKIVALLSAEKERIEQSVSIAGIQNGVQSMAQGASGKESHFAKWRAEKENTSSKKVVL